MSRKNNKGFTLVELLAVLVILITILTIAIPSITSSLDRHKEKILNKKTDIIETMAETYVNQYKNKINYNKLKDGTISEGGKEYGSCCITVIKIQNEGLLTNDDLLDADKNKIEGVVCYDKLSKEYMYREAHPSGSEDC